jgi:hypothetical protein
MLITVTITLKCVENYMINIWNKRIIKINKNTPIFMSS